MKLIVGLGNPGRIYIDSRHNIGFSVLKRLAKVYKISLKEDKRAFSLTGKGKIEGEDVIFSIPLTFMNSSGVVVKTLLKKYKKDLALPFYHRLDTLNSKKVRDLDNLLVICDDMDLEFGRLKIRPYGSSGGHRGLKSIIDSLTTDRFSRLRIGIGRPKTDIYAKDYVLSTFTEKEKMEVKEIIGRAIECCRVWVSEGIFKAMNIFNRRS